MLQNDYYGQAEHGPFETFDVGDVLLEDGMTLRGCQLAYATFGTLSAAKDNAILVPTWFGGTNKVMEQVYIGLGRALDPERYFIIIVNQIGSGLSTSPHNAAGPASMASFPHVRTGDDVVAQQRLLEQKFGIDRLALVVGGSMGAQQVYEWAVRFPDRVERAAPIAGTAQTTPHDMIYVEALADALTSDPAWANGWYREPHAVRAGLERHARLWALMGLSPKILREEGWRQLGMSSREDFLVNFLFPFFARMDPNDLLMQLWKWREADVARHAHGDLAAALGRITARTTVLPISSDMFFTVADCAADQAMIPDSELCILGSDWGHMSLFGLDPLYNHQVDGALKSLLAR